MGLRTNEITIAFLMDIAERSLNGKLIPKQQHVERIQALRKRLDALEAKLHWQQAGLDQMGQKSG